MSSPQFKPVVAAAELEAVRGFLATGQPDSGLPLVDESEKLRLDALVENRPTPDWQPYVSMSTGNLCAYAGLLRTESESDVHLELAVNRSVVDGDQFGSLLNSAAALAPGASLWIRGLTVAERLACTAAGFAIARELAIYRCVLTSPPDARESPSGMEASIRSMEAADVDAVASVLAAAYAGTAEAGWTSAAVASRLTLPWFRFDDVLLAVGGDGVRVEGLHWMKRRDDVTAEVYNLAIHPRAHSRGLGRQLLEAGKRHMEAAGFSNMILWVDVANEPAVRLYESTGFVRYSLDVMVSPPLRLSRSR